MLHWSGGENNWIVIYSHIQANRVSSRDNAIEWCSEIIKGAIPLEKPAAKCLGQGNDGDCTCLALAL